MSGAAPAERERRRARLELVAAAARLAAAGLILPGEGNLSRRLGDGTVLITPQGADKGRLAPADVVELAPGGGTAGGASSEVAMHLAVYGRRPEVAAVVHGHPPWVLRLGGRGRAPDCHHLEEAELYLGRVGWAAFHPSGSAALARAVAAALDGVNAAVLDRHGAVAVGADLETALRRLLLLERLAELERDLR